MDEKLDLDIALSRLYRMGLDDGDLGYAYWYQVRKLLQRASGMQAEIAKLTEDLEQSRTETIEECASVCRRYAENTTYLSNFENSLTMKDVALQLETKVLGLLNSEGK
jgi:hypothetical protein